MEVRPANLQRLNSVASKRAVLIPQKTVLRFDLDFPEVPPSDALPARKSVRLPRVASRVAEPVKVSGEVFERFLDCVPSIGLVREDSRIIRSRVIEEMYRIQERAHITPEERAKLFQIALSMDAPRLARKLVTDRTTEEVGAFLTGSPHGTSVMEEDEVFSQALEEVERIRQRLLQRATSSPTHSTDPSVLPSKSTSKSNSKSPPPLRREASSVSVASSRRNSIELAHEFTLRDLADSPEEVPDIQPMPLPVPAPIQSMEMLVDSSYDLTAARAAEVDMSAAHRDLQHFHHHDDRSSRFPRPAGSGHRHTASVDSLHSSALGPRPSALPPLGGGMGLLELRQAKAMLLSPLTDWIRLGRSTSEEVQSKSEQVLLSPRNMGSPRRSRFSFDNKEVQSSAQLLTNARRTLQRLGDQITPPPVDAGTPRNPAQYNNFLHTPTNSSSNTASSAGRRASPRALVSQSLSTVRMPALVHPIRPATGAASASAGASPGTGVARESSDSSAQSPAVEKKSNKAALAAALNAGDAVGKLMAEMLTKK